ncbi:hypothetical protein C6P40_004474 [Pichia californica]|uniref:Uncharacterized protein n=1 Tax=Pichia californica TaxID=460514 RepID=A0A9P6WFN8_9ASCO|nr:hypothetical protein C6P40_004474 [[Candida] californica]
MRRIYEENDFVVAPNTWRVKAPFLSYQIDGLDFMRASVPDIMHVVCENVFPKRIYFIYEHETLKSLDETVHLLVINQAKDIHVEMMKCKMFEDVPHLNRLKHVHKSYLKAVDFKILCHTFALYFIPILNHN